MLPFDEAGEVDWVAFTAHVEQTRDAELILAVNLDTGSVNLPDRATSWAVAPLWRVRLHPTLRVTLIGSAQPKRGAM